MWNNTLIILIAVSMLLLAVFYRAHRRIIRLRNRRQLQGIKLNMQLKSLLLNIQKQRGLCLRMLNGEVQLKVHIDRLYGENEHTINSLEYTYSRLLDNDSRWLNIRRDWAKLRSAHGDNTGAERSFLIHNQLIEDIIYLMGDVAERQQSDLQRVISHDEIKIIWENIPQTLEAMGKARAIGSGVATAGVCSPANRIKLKYLNGEITRHHRAVARQLRDIFGQQVNDMAGDIDVKIDNLVNVVRDKLVSPQFPQVAAEDFFDQASGAMEVVSQLYDTLSDIKQQQLESSVSRTLH